METTSNKDKTSDSDLKKDILKAISSALELVSITSPRAIKKVKERPPKLDDSATFPSKLWKQTSEIREEALDEDQIHSLSDEEKIEIVIEALKDGNLSKIAHKYGKAERTLRFWRSKYGPDIELILQAQGI